jgi:hypothetical protein
LYGVTMGNLYGVIMGNLYGVTMGNLYGVTMGNFSSTNARFCVRHRKHILDEPGKLFDL